MKISNHHSIACWLSITGILICLVVSGCGVDPRLRKTETAAKATVAELPFMADMDVIGEVPVRAYPSVIDSSICTYAEYFRAYGTELREQDALDSYISLLEKQGWEEVERTAGSRFLVRGTNETLDVSTYPMSGWYVSDLDPGNRRANYPTVLHLRLFIALPQQEGC